MSTFAGYQTSPFQLENISLFKKFKKTKKILMIEDNKDTTSLMRKVLLASLKCKLDIAENSYEALELLNDKVYDIIILDWQLPGLNGNEILMLAEDTLDSEPYSPIHWVREKTPVVIFSATNKEDCLYQNTEHFNFIGFVSKSLPLNKIIEVLGDYIKHPFRYRYHLAH